FLERVEVADRLTRIERKGLLLDDAGELARIAPGADHDDQLAVGGLLRLGFVDLILWRFADPSLSDVAYDTDDFAPRVDATPEIEPFSDGTFIRKILPGQSLIDDGDAEGLCAVCVGEKASLAQRDLHRLKISRGNPIVVREGPIRRGVVG